MKLSLAQEKALQKMKPGGWYSAYALQASLKTMYALEKKGHVTSRGYNEPGAFSMERTVVEWSKRK